MGAALVDLVPLSLLATAWSDRSTATGGWNVQLSGWHLVLVAVTAFAYHAVCEAATGATLGKWMLGLVVARDDGRPVGWRAAAIRTALRVVDGLPVFYLVGFIVFLATPNRQRVGDLVAGTRVIDRHDVQSATTPRRSIAGVLMIGSVVGVLGLAVLGWTRPAAQEQVGRFSYDDEVVPFVEQVADDVFRQQSVDALMDALVPGVVERDDAVAAMSQVDAGLGSLDGELAITDHRVFPDTEIVDIGAYDAVEVIANAMFDEGGAEIRFIVADYDGELRLVRWDIEPDDE